MPGAPLCFAIRWPLTACWRFGATRWRRSLTFRTHATFSQFTINPTICLDTGRRKGVYFFPGIRARLAPMLHGGRGGGKTANMKERTYGLLPGAENEVA